MGLDEWYWLYDAKRTDKPVPGSNLSEDELWDLYELIKDS